MSDESIYPIHQLYFKCDGCGAEWMIRPDPPLNSAADIKAFTSDPARMHSCPKECGAKTCSMLFRVGKGDGKSDPFDVFKEKK